MDRRQLKVKGYKVSDRELSGALQIPDAYCANSPEYRREELSPAFQLRLSKMVGMGVPVQSLFLSSRRLGAR
jgi:hypothetical protein